MTVVTAAPGAGVTSLFRAGLVPELLRRNFIPVYYTGWQGRFFGTEFKEAIAQTVRELVDENFYAEAELLVEMLDRVRLRTGRTVVLLLDDFHDYLSAHTNSDFSDSFDAEISQALAGREGRTIVGIHESALPRLERLQPQVPGLLSYRHPLPLLSPEAGRTMLEQRAEAAGLTVEPEAAELLLQCPLISTLAGVQPYFLSLAAERVFSFEVRIKSRTVHAATIVANGGVPAILNEYFDGTIDEMNSSHKDLFFRLCNLLVTAEKVRVAVSEKELTEYSGKLNRFMITLLPQLIEKDILRPVDFNGVQYYEFRRAGMAPVIRDWWERTEAKIVARRRAVFRVTSISLAVGAIVLVYIIYLIAK